MATFLTTPRMSPALAARVEDAVRGRKGKSAPIRTALARLAVAGTIVAVVTVFLLNRPSCTSDVDQERALFLGEIREATADVTDHDRALPERVHAWLETHAAYEGDVIDPTMREPGALYRALERPTVYLRVPLDALGSIERIANAAEESFRDTFVLCLASPPEKRTEKSLANKARAAFGGADVPGANVERFASALAATPVLEPAWLDQVKAADSQTAIGKLRKALVGANLDRGKRALKSELLLALIDEPKDGDRPSELDGAHAHHVRVVLVELDSGRALFQLRKHVDPAWISAGNRAELATGINACELALDVRADVLPKK